MPRCGQVDVQYTVSPFGWIDFFEFFLQKSISIGLLIPSIQYRCGAELLCSEFKLIPHGFQLWSDKNALRLIRLSGTLARTETFVAAALTVEKQKDDLLLLLLDSTLQSFKEAKSGHIFKKQFLSSLLVFAFFMIFWWHFRFLCTFYPFVWPFVISLLWSLPNTSINK